MIGLDTNVLVRYLAQDDVRQAAQANEVMESLSAQAPGFISIVALIETVWVLGDLYARKREDIAALLEVLLETEGLVLQMAPLVRQVLREYGSGRADFADHLIACLGAAEGCQSTLTFDKTAARDAGMRLVSAALA